MNSINLRVNEAVSYIRKNIKDIPKVGIILGSGLGSVMKNFSSNIEIEYKDIPHFPYPTVEGHLGLLSISQFYGNSVLIMKGRSHYYEGYDMQDVTFATRVLGVLGVDTLIVTNAAGAVNRDFSPGSIMLIKDHIDLFMPSPLRGRNIDEWGTRFPDMTQAYDRCLLRLAKECAGNIQLNVKEGIYAYIQGPCFETPADIRAISILGADVVGMSTVPEVVVARHSSMRVLGISCITNMAAGILGKPITHEEVTDTTKKIEVEFGRLLERILESMFCEEENS